ncbi:hypothetical protein C8F01DRAFT_1086033 [Mycena amicta]|nr:hypothetical protein C8F01DRAFT_1086033 [Mycena amicta]
MDNVPKHGDDGVEKNRLALNPDSLKLIGAAIEVASGLTVEELLQNEVSRLESTALWALKGLHRLAEANDSDQVSLFAAQIKSLRTSMKALSTGKLFSNVQLPEATLLRKLRVVLILGERKTSLLLAGSRVLTAPQQLTFPIRAEETDLDKLYCKETQKKAWDKDWKPIEGITRGDQTLQKCRKAGRDHYTIKRLLESIYTSITAAECRQSTTVSLQRTEEGVVAHTSQQV